MTWPPPRPDETLKEGRPWDPGHPRQRSLQRESKRLVYVVVDERLEDSVGLSFALWPHADDAGRLRFPDDRDPIEVSTSRKSLQRFLATENAGGGVADRSRPGDRARESDGDAVDVRIGMTFGARVKRGLATRLLERLRDRAAHGQVRINDLRTILTRPVDLTGHGRLLAKLASYGAFSSTLPREVGERWRLTDEIEG
jgi:hypothetical protein